VVPAIDLGSLAAVKTATAGAESATSPGSIAASQKRSREPGSAPASAREGRQSSRLRTAFDRHNKKAGGQ
jgi:hypothetical protein